MAGLDTESHTVVLGDENGGMQDSLVCTMHHQVKGWSAEQYAFCGPTLPVVYLMVISGAGHC